MLILLIKSLNGVSNISIIELTNFMCRTEYVMANKNSMPHEGLIKIVMKAATIADRKGINEVITNFNFNLSPS